MINVPCPWTDSDRCHVIPRSRFFHFDCGRPVRLVLRPDGLSCAGGRRGVCRVDALKVVGESGLTHGGAAGRASSHGVGGWLWLRLVIGARVDVVGSALVPGEIGGADGCATLGGRGSWSDGMCGCELGLGQAHACTTCAPYR
jgi:hypothetical protein